MKSTRDEREERGEPPTRGWLIGLFLLVATALVAPTAGFAQTETEIQAQRQLDFAKEELGNGAYERALSSASAAFRLDPTLYDALVYKALAYEGLGELSLAEGLLTTYMDLRGDLDPDPVAGEALERIKGKLGGGSGGGSGGGGGGSSDGGGDEGTGDSAGAGGDGSSDGAGEEGDGSTDGAGEEGDGSTDGAGEEGDGSTDGSGEEGDGSTDGSGEDGETDSGTTDGGGEDATEGDGSGEGSEEGSEPVVLSPTAAFLESLWIERQRELLSLRRDTGMGFLFGGIGLATTGGVLMVISSVRYLQLATEGETTVQVQALYSGAIGMIGSGAALSLVGLPIVIDSSTKLAKMKQAEGQALRRPPPRLELASQGLLLRF